MANEIRNTFELDITQYTQAINSAIGSMQTYDKATEEATKDTANLSGESGSAAKKVRELATASDIASGSLGERLSAKSKEVAVAFGQLRDATGGTIPALKAFAKELGVVASERFPKLAGAFNGLKSGLGKVGGAIKGAASNIADYSKGVAGSIPVVGNLLVALGPIGIAAGAVAGGLFKIFTNLDAGVTIVDGFKRSAGIAFDQVTGATKRFFDSLSTGDTIASKVFGAIVEGLKVTATAFNPLILAYRTLFAEAIEAGQEIATLYDNLDEAQTNNIVNNAKLNQQVEKLIIQLKDRTKTEQDRLAIADKITALETQRAAEEQKLLKQATAAIQREADVQLKAKGEVDDALRRRLAEAQAAEINAATASTAILERAEVRKNAIIEQAQAERIAIQQKEAEQAEKLRQKRIEAEQKAAAERKKAEEAATEAAAKEAERRAQIQGAANEQLTKIRQERELAALTEAERQELLVREAARKELEITRKLFNDLLSITDQADLPSVRAQQAEAILGIEMQLAEDLAALRASQVEEDTAAQEAETARLQEQLDRRVALLDATGQAVGGILQDLASSNEDILRNASRALIGIAFQALEAQVPIWTARILGESLAQPDSVSSFGATGITRAAIIAALLRAGLAGVRGAVTGAFHDGGLVGRDGGTKMHGGRDGFLTRVERGEYVMPTNKTAQYMPYLEAMRDGSFERLYSLRMPTSNDSSTQLPKWSDKGIVSALGGVGSMSEQRKQTVLLAQVASALNRGHNKRYLA